ncbi:hypothetical protein BCR42DRAFT_409258 [Absidia repens]|uniref:TM7S3/TM198-like domain-containing protein n=1 Tax=Absidia repens TaxID=90262 RepID=A0A1X2IQX9_9FUNG|nr:hypothetical protein BCR42DRAFT_409258 [Absidia repens]
MGLWLRGFIDSTGILTRFFVGFLSFAFIAWVMLANFEPASTYGVNRWSLYLAVVVALGLVGGLLFCLCDLIAVYAAMLGGLGGLAIGLWVLGWRDNLSITSAWGRAVLLCLLALVGFLWAAYSVNASILGSAFAGSYVLMLGLDVYFHTGFTYCATTVLDANPAHAHTYVVYRETYIMQGIIILAFIVGFISQIIQRSLLTIQSHFDHPPVYLRSFKYGMRERWNPFGPPAAVAVAPPP